MLTRDEIHALERDAFGAVEAEIRDMKSAGTYTPGDAGELYSVARAWVNEHIDAAIPRDPFGDFAPLGKIASDADW